MGLPILQPRVQRPAQTTRFCFFFFHVSGLFFKAKGFFLTVFCYCGCVSFARLKTDLLHCWWRFQYNHQSSDASSVHRSRSKWWMTGIHLGARVQTTYIDDAKHWPHKVSWEFWKLYLPICLMVSRKLADSHKSRSQPYIPTDSIRRKYCAHFNCIYFVDCWKSII